jgi:DNA helicase-2/ATP-dependent DNA helicase PcrA
MSLIPQKIITFSGLLLFAYYLLQNKSVKNFYQQYYKMIIVDEFQDTNYLAYRLITQLIGDNKIILLGDDIQKIYGFLGAIPNLFNHMAEEYNMEKLQFSTNHRFSNNEKMRNLDKYIRDVFEEYDNIYSYAGSAEINFKFLKDAESEAEIIVDHIWGKIQDSENVSVLVRARFCA